MPSRSTVSALLALIALLPAFPEASLASPASRSLSEAKEAAESQTTSLEEERADDQQRAFEEEFELDSSAEADEPGKEPDFRAILRRSVKQRVGKGKARKTITVTPKVEYGVRFTGPSTYQEGADTPIAPASTNKLFTAALVLKELGGDYRYETRLTWVNGPKAGEAGYLTLVAAGDPSLTTPDLAKVTDEYAAGLIAAGVKKIHGPLRFSATDRRWNVRAVPDGWKSEDTRSTTGFIPDALGTLTEARVRSILAAKLAKKGIKWLQSATAPFGEKEGTVGSASHLSEPLRKLIQPFVLHSINYKGEAFLRKVGELRGAKAAANLHAAGLPILREFVTETLLRGGTPAIHGTPGYLVNDASGLSRTSRVTARLMVDFLEAAKKEPFFADLLASLPIAGRTGTLGRRMSGTSAAGRIHAKTGTLDGNYQLAGYLAEVTKEGTLYHPFAILTETDAASAGYCRSVEDAALANLAAWMLSK